MRVMLLERSDYYTQRNNPYKPLSACVPTSRIMWYIACNIPVLYGRVITYHIRGERRELVLDRETMDNQIMLLLNSDEAIDFCHAKYPWTTNRKKASGEPLPDIPPNEVHGMYGSWLDALVTGARRSDFRTNLSWEDYLAYLDHGYAMQTSGAFPTTQGHGVLVAGFEVGGSLLYLADPYGDHRTAYRDTHGYGVPLTREDWAKYLNGESSSAKWGHVPYGVKI